jgi:hypothetical protein
MIDTAVPTQAYLLPPFIAAIPAPIPDYYKL